VLVQVTTSLQLGLGLVPYSHSVPGLEHGPPSGGDAGHTGPVPESPVAPELLPEPPPLDEPPLELPLDEPPLELPLDEPPLELPLDEPPLEPPELDPAPPSLPPSSPGSKVAPPHAHIVAKAHTVKSLERMGHDLPGLTSKSNTETTTNRPRDGSRPTPICDAAREHATVHAPRAPAAHRILVSLLRASGTACRGRNGRPPRAPNDYWHPVAAAWVEVAAVLYSDTTKLPAKFVMETSSPPAAVCAKSEFGP
jgi:hypothetical protein